MPPPLAWGPRHGFRDPVTFSVGLNVAPCHGPNLIVPPCRRTLETAICTQYPKAADFESNGKWIVGKSADKSLIRD